MWWFQTKSLEEKIQKKTAKKTRDRSQSLVAQCFPVGILVPAKSLFSFGEENELYSPTQSRLNSEQLIFDIYLNSPSKKRRHLEAIKVWDCGKLISKQNKKPIEKKHSNPIGSIKEISSRWSLVW